MEELDFDDEWGQFAEFSSKVYKKFRDSLNSVQKQQFFEGFKNCSTSRSKFEFLLDHEDLIKLISEELVALNEGHELEALEFDENCSNHPTESVNQLPSCITIEESSERGRHLIANQEIPGNQVLISREPISCWLKPSLIASHCSNCFEELTHCDQLIECSKCYKVRYCSKNCQETGFANFHRFECSLMNVLNHCSSGQLALRLMFKTGLRTCLELFRRVEEDKKQVVNCDYWQLLQLVDHYDEYDLVTLISDSIGICFLIMILQQTGLTKSLPESDIPQLASLILKHVYQIAVNGIQIVSRTISEQSTKSEQQLGVGLYLDISLLNHSCYSRLQSQFTNTRLDLIVREDGFKVGDEITFNYGPHYKVISDREVRRKILRTFYFFECNCLACELDWK